MVSRAITFKTTEVWKLLIFPVTIVLRQEEDIDLVEAGNSNILAVQSTIWEGKLILLI